MPTFVAMSSRNRWVAISTNGLLSGIRDSDAISALSLDPRAAHDERVDALVVPQEGTHVVLVDVHLGHVLRGDLRLPAPSAGGEEEAGERVPRDGDVLRDLLPEPFVEYAEIADRDVVHVFIVLVRHGLVRRTHPPDREPRPENRRDVAALAHRIQIPDDVPVDVRDRHVRERRNVAFGAEGGAGLPDGHVERGPSEVRLLAHAAREVVPDPLPELDDAVRPGLLDHVLDQGGERDVDHERPPASSHEGADHLLQVRAPLFLGLRGDRIAFQIPQPVDDDRQESVPMPRRHVGRGRADLVVGHRDDFLEVTRPDEHAELRLEVLRDLLVLLELLRLAELLDEQDPREPFQFSRDRLVVRGQDFRRDRPRLEEVAHDDRGLEDVREDALHLRDLDGLRRQEDEERAVSDAGDDDRAGLELLDGHHHVLPAQLIADVGQIALQQVQQAILAGIELVRDRRREDAAVDAGEHRDVEVVLFPRPLQLRLQEMLQMADRVGPHRLVDLARVGHLSAPLQPVRTEQDLQGLFRRVVVVPVLLHLPDALDDAGRRLHRLGGLDRLIERLTVAAALLLGDVRRTRSDHDADAAGEQVRVHAFAVVYAAHLQEFHGAVERPSDRVVLEVDCAVRKVDRQEDVLADRLAGLRMFLDRAQDDAEFFQRVEELANQLALLELLCRRPDDRRHRVDHDTRLDVVIRPSLDKLRQLLLDHLLEIAALEMDEEKAFLVVLAHVEAHEVGLAHNLLRRFLERHVEGLFALLDAFHQELDRERGLARPARTQDDDGRLGPKSAFDQIVESGNPARYSLDVRHGQVPPDRRSLDREGGASLGRMRDSMPAAF